MLNKSGFTYYEGYPVIKAEYIVSRRHARKKDVSKWLKLCWKYISWASSPILDQPKVEVPITGIKAWELEELIGILARMKYTLDELSKPGYLIVSWRRW